VGTSCRVIITSPYSLDNTNLSTSVTCDVTAWDSGGHQDNTTFQIIIGQVFLCFFSNVSREIGEHEMIFNGHRTQSIKVEYTVIV